MSGPFFMNRVLFGQSNLIENGGLNQLSCYMLTPDNFLPDDDNMKIEDPLTIEPKTVLSVEPGAVEPKTVLSVEPGAVEPKTVLSVEPKTVLSKQTRYITRERDSIFWSIYTAINGPNTAPNAVNLMMNEKKAMSDYFNKNPNTLKNINHKVTLAKINEIKCNLMTKPFMEGIESFIPCSIYYKRPIFVFYEEINAYFTFVDKTYVSDDDDDADGETILIYANGNRFSLETCKTKTSDFVRNQKSALVYLHDLERIISGISSFKVEELKKYYNIVFSKDEDPGFNKTQYYEKVLMKCYTTVKGTKI
jgi:hypothetical protein